jgi:hypothetical protein
MPPIDNIEPQHEDRHNRNMAALFGDDAPPQDPPQDEPGDDAPPQDPPQDEPGDDAPPQDPPQDDPEETPADDVEEDYDAPASKKDKAAEDEPEPENETVARKMAKENGRRAKLAEAKLREHELEIDRLKSELEAEKARREEIEAVQVDPRDFPEVKSLREKVLNDVKRGAALLGVRDPKTFRDNFGSYITSFMDADALDGEEFDAAILNLRKQIIKDVGGFEDAYDDLDFTEQARADAIADKAMAVLERAVPDTKKAIELAEGLKSRAKTGQLMVGTREYQAAVAEYQPVLDAIGDLPDEVIEADPHSIPTVVARMVKESPEARRRLERAKADVLEIIVGPRAITQEEAEKLQANGTDLKTFYAERQKLVAEKRKKLIPLLVQGLATRSVFADVVKKLAKYEAANASDEEEFDVMRQVRSPKPVPKKKPDPVPAGKRRNSVLTEMFGGNYDEL